MNKENKDIVLYSTRGEARYVSRNNNTTIEENEPQENTNKKNKKNKKNNMIKKLLSEEL